MAYVATEIEPERQASTVKATPEATRHKSIVSQSKGSSALPFMRILPLAIHNPESDILIRRTGTEVK
jgi:hypothetical protein